MVRGSLLFIAIGLVFLPRGTGAAEVGRKGRIQGESYVNCRSGPGISFDPIAVLRKGQEVHVVGEERGWYRVSLPGGQEGYIDKRFILLLGQQEVTRAPRREEAVTEPDREEPKDSEVTSSPPSERRVVRGRRIPLILLLEGKKWEILRWLGVFVCIFVLGWICGGSYYLRRERAQRSRLRF